jgi:hypothetical protein
MHPFRPRPGRPKRARRRSPSGRTPRSLLWLPAGRPGQATERVLDRGLRKGRQIPATVPRSFFYEFPAAPHIQLASFNPVSSCARSITDQFLRAPGRRPDSGCIASLPQFDFTP